MKATFCLSLGTLLLINCALSAGTLYVSKTSANPTPPYSTWATAAVEIQSAVDAAAASDTILVANGIYQGGITISKPLTLLSANGPQFTRIDGGGSNRCLYVTSPTSVSGFTMTNGWTLTDGGGVWSSYLAAFLTNCILSGNCASNGGGAYEATLYNCALTDNCATNGSGGAAFVCELHNCTVAGNTAARGGGTFYSYQFNSIIYSNTSTNGSNYSQVWGMTNCCTSPMPEVGWNNLTNDPLFVDYSGGDYHLQSSSPCINAGNNNYALGATDLDGNDRYSGTAVDIGAYEFQQPSSPMITQQPSDLLVASGNDANFNVHVVGSLPLSCQWHFNGAPMAHATNTSLLLSAVTSNQAGGYSVVVTNPLGSVTSKVAVLTVLEVAPSITVQPSNQTAYVGSTVTFQANAAGSLPMVWNWRFNGAPIPGAKGPSLTLQSVTTNQSGNYSVVVTNSIGSATSQVAILTVNGAEPLFTQEPANQAVYFGSNATFTAKASGVEPLSWQWWFNGAVISNATASSLNLTSVTTANSGTYWVAVSNLFGGATSSVATLTVMLQPGESYVWAGSPTPTPPYTNWATAAHTIQDAVDSALPGNQIFVTNGVYSTGGRLATGSAQLNRVAIDKAVAVQSINGPGVTTIEGYQLPGTTNGPNSMRCALLVNGAVLNGFTLTGGATGVFLPDWSPYDPYGGGVLCLSSNAIVTNCVFTGNSAYGPGGGASGGTIRNCTFNHNSAAFGGAASGGTLFDCLIISNSARMGGGVDQATLTRCLLTSNFASEEGGGASESYLANCTLMNNMCDAGGGAYYGTLVACVLSGNTAAQGGGAIQATLDHCTLTGNSAQTGGGASGSSLTNCIVYYNYGANGQNYYDCTLAYSCSTPFAPGPGNIDAEPLLASASHLSAESPCIAKGTTGGSNGVDIDGESWLNPPCMGADQIIAGQATGPVNVAIKVPYTSVSAGFQLQLEALIDGRVTGSSWDFGDGIVVSNHPYASHAWSAPGSYIVRLTATSDTYTTGSAGTLVVQVTPQQVFYVDASNPSPQYPYTNWSQAANTIQAAIDSGSQIGRVVLVTNGVYASGGRAVYGQMTNCVVATEGAQVRSVNGPAATIIRGTPSALGSNNDGAVRCAYVANNASLSGFTLSNGFTRAVQFSTLESSGGGAWSEVGGLITNCVLTANSAGYEGGGVYGGTVSGCILSSNSAGLGGAAFGSALNHCRLTNNWAGQGGATFMATLNTCVLRGNYAGQGGAAAYGTLNNCALIGNSAGTGYGGGVYDATLKNCVLTGNTANQGGGAYAEQGQGVLDNCTLTGNYATDSGGGAYSGVLNNCIVYYNEAPNGANYFGGTILSYSCTTPGAPGPGNIESEPLLASATHLSAQSPCIGRGSAADSTGVDIDGEAWQNPPCMGADQFVGGVNTSPLTVDIFAPYTNAGAAFAMPFQAVIEGQTAASVWDFGDGVIVSNTPYATHTWMDPGQYLVQLTAYNDSHPNGVSATVAVQVGATQVYYVNAMNSTPVAPYTNWAGAATNIQDAIDAGTGLGRLVLVDDGVYNTGLRSLDGISTNRIVLSAGVELRSVNGPAVTSIVGDVSPSRASGGGVRCVYVSSNAVVSGFTLTNGFAYANSLSGGNGGGATCEASAVITNCVFSGNSAAYNGGGAYGGALYNCILNSNQASAYGGGAAGGVVNHCVFQGNSASSGGGAYDATLNWCTLSNNTGYSYGGGGAFMSTLNNCLLVGNMSGAGGGVFGGTLTGCTLNGNRSGFGGGAMGATLYNCIVYYDSAPGCVMNYCCTAELPANGVGNITNEPAFVDMNRGDLHLRPDSPCINAGNNAYASGATDLDGNPRIAGGTADIGAYEYQGLHSLISQAWLQQYGLPADGSADFTDADGDGMNNWQEWVCGTDPSDPRSVLRLLSVSPPGAGVSVTWQSVPGINYYVERGEILNSFGSAVLNVVGIGTNVFFPTNIVLIATDIQGQTNITSYCDTNATGSGPFFYRIGVKAP